MRNRLVELARAQGTELLSWKQAVAPGRRRVQQELGEQESRAGHVWVCSLDVIPGLAQTERYAEAMFRMGRDDSLADCEIGEAVTARMAREAVLSEPGKQIDLLCTETALRRSLLPTPDMRAQLDRLLVVAAIPTVRLGVIPFRARELTHTYHGFAILGDPETDEHALARAGTVTRMLTVRDRDEVRDYVQHFRRLAESAVYGEQLQRLIQEVRQESPWH